MDGPPRTRQGRDDEPIVSAWVWTANLHPWLQLLGRICGYGLDDLDWAMIDLELEGTDAGQGRWLDHRLAGDETIELALAEHPGSGMTAVRVWGPDHLRGLAELATHVAGAYQLR